jgi:uncharacterized protein
VPVSQLVLKLAGRCNLDCDYCYIYHAADQSWRTRPRLMSPAVLEATVRRVGEHATRHQVGTVRFGLHGGEPLLAGPAAVERAVRTIRAGMPPQVRVELGVQTNGVLLDSRFLELFHQHRVRVSVSLDGDTTATGRHRRRHDGGNSYPAVAAALRRLGAPRYRHLFAGLLCTIDLANDPEQVYDSLLAFEPPTVDFLLPHGNWSAPPPGWAPATTPYAGWLARVFDRWYDEAPKQTGVRLFEEMINLLLGGHSRIEALGGGPVSFLVVDTDGSIEQSGALKSAYHGAADTGLSVLHDSFDAALDHPGIAARQAGRSGLCSTCQTCPVRDVCGGGLYPHRYRRGAGFANPSVYCADLRALIEHVAGRLHADLVSGRAGPG